ncbi:glycine/sarcosine/betaine reductase component B subunit [Chloroflexota bacterium]
MRLELDIHNIKDVKFSDKTIVSDGILYIDRQELQTMLQQDKRLEKVDIELAHPGENCRVLQISDVIEPRAKIGATDADFPGALGKQGTVGEGSTGVLRGVAVVITDKNAESGPSHEPIGSIIDMSGPGAELSIYAKTHNIVILPHPSKEFSPDDYKVAIKLAGLKTAVYLARAAASLEPDEIEVYDLPPLTDITKDIEHLPKMAYIFQVYCTSFPPIQGEPIVYGDSIRRLVPTIIHPNEVLDGAIINPYQGMGIETYTIQNHPVIQSLYRHHGKDLSFVGVILTVSQYTEPERERSVAIAANLAKSLLGADGVILTKSSAGAPDVDVAQIAQRCEELGVKAVLLMWETTADGSDKESGVVFNIPGANDMVSTGVPLVEVQLPAVQRIIGDPNMLPSGVPADGEIARRILWISGAVGQLGGSKLMSVRY